MIAYCKMGSQEDSPRASFFVDFLVELPSILRDRLMAGRQTLNLSILVRIQVPQLEITFLDDLRTKFGILYQVRLNFRKLSTAKKIFISLLLCLLLLVVGLVIIINFYILVINIPLKGNYAQINIENGSINIFIPKGDSTWIYLHNLNHPDTITPTETTLHQNMTFIQIIPIHQNQPSIVGSQTTSLPTAKKTYIQDMSHWQTYTTSQFYFQYPPGWQVLSGSEYTVFDPRSVHRIFNKYANSWATGYDHQMTVKVENTRYFDKVYTPEGYVKFICTTFNSQARLSINETDQEGKKVFRAICSSPAEINNYIYNDNVLLQVYTLYESPEIANKFLSSIIITSP